ncbi:MAG: carbohydrate binding domain-containing protein, partial [Actinomycetota bacterium]
MIPRSASVELSLNEAESIDVGLTLPLVDPSTGVAIDIPNQLLPGRDFLGWVENGVVLAAGQIQGDPFTFPRSSSIKASGMGAYFDHRFVLPVLESGVLPRDVTSQWSGLSLGTIAKRLVQQALAHPGAGLPIDFEADEVGIHEREYPGSDGMSVRQALANLTNVEGGPDVTFRPKLAEDRRHVRWDMLTGSPHLTQGGADHYWDVSAPGPHAAVVDLDRDGRDLASRSFLTGTTVRNVFKDADFRDGVGQWKPGGTNGTLNAMVAGPAELAMGAKGYSLSTWSGASGSGAGGAASTPTITVTEGEVYFLSVMAQGTSKPVRLAVAWNDENGEVSQEVLMLGNVVTSEYRFFSGVVTVPAGISKMNIFMYPQVGQQWATGNTLRTTKWHGYRIVDASDAALPYFYDEMRLEA